MALVAGSHATATWPSSVKRSPRCTRTSGSGRRPRRWIDPTPSTSPARLSTPDQGATSPSYIRLTAAEAPRLRLTASETKRVTPPVTCAVQVSKLLRAGTDPGGADGSGRRDVHV